MWCRFIGGCQSSSGKLVWQAVNNYVYSSLEVFNWNLVFYMKWNYNSLLYISVTSLGVLFCRSILRCKSTTRLLLNILLVKTALSRPLNTWNKLCLNVCFLHVNTSIRLIESFRVFRSNIHENDYEEHNKSLEEVG